MGSQVEFFDRVCRQWDEMSRPDAEKIRFLLSRSGLKPDETVLDIGCGTGVLYPFIREINRDGAITAVDISAGMIDVAAEKYGSEPGLSLKVADVESDLLEGEYDRILLYSVFPHLNDKTGTIKKLVTRNLKPGGTLIIAHAQSREFLNHMHKHKDAQVSEDMLIEVSRQRDEFIRSGIRVTGAFENDEYYYLLIG